MKKFVTILAFAAALMGCKEQKPFIDVQAHRGGAGLMPENTIPAMKNAIDLGVNTLEFDLQLSADKQVVVSHDAFFDSRYSTRPDGSLIQKGDPTEYRYQMPYDSIAKYDVGLRPVDRWPTQQKMAAVKPLAADLIDFTEQYGKEKMNYNIEIKSWPGPDEGTLWPDYKTFCDVCIPLLIEKIPLERLIVQCFDTRALEYMHTNWPELTLSFLTEAEGFTVEDIMEQPSFTPAWWSPEHSEVTPENVAWCHERGIKVVPWTVDEPEEMLRLVDCGVDAIISNYPDILIATVR